MNKEKVYGVNIPKSIKDPVVSMFKRSQLNIKNSSKRKRKNRFRLRFHTAVVIKLIESVINDLRKVDMVNFQICNDFDGHFHEIKDMIFKHISKRISCLKPEDIIQTKFQKPSFIDNSGKAIRNKDKCLINGFNIISLDLEELVSLIKK